MIAKSSTNPVFLSARTGAEAAAKDLSAKYRPRHHDRLAHAADRGRPGAGPAHRAGGQRRRQCHPDLLLGRGQGDRRHQRRRRARRAGHDLRQRRAAVQALRLLRRGRHQDRRAGDGRAGQAHRQQGQGGDPGRQPERAEPAEARRGREGGRQEVPGHRDRRHLLPHRRRRRTPRPRSLAS